MKPSDAFDENRRIVRFDQREYVYRCKFCGHETAVDRAGGRIDGCCDRLMHEVKHNNRGVVNDFYDVLVP